MSRELLAPGGTVLLEVDPPGYERQRAQMRLSAASTAAKAPSLRFFIPVLRRRVVRRVTGNGTLTARQIQRCDLCP
jgi:hypothetical protein